MPRTPEPKPAHAPMSAPDAISAKEMASENGKVPLLGDPVATDLHPLAHLAGKYNDEPIWDDFLQAMHETRRKMNAEDDAAEQTTVHP